MKRAGHRLTRLGKFNLVGAMGAALQLGLLSALTRRAHLPVVAATPLAVEMVVLHNFVWHESYTWRDRRRVGENTMATRLWRFHAGDGMVSLVGNTALAYCLVELLKAPVLLSATVAIVVCSLINFFLADRWVYVN